MNIIRKQELKTNELQLGDQVRVGKYTATCQKITDDNAIFLLDQYLEKSYAMNSLGTNEGGYDTSDLRSEFKNIILDPNFDAIRDLLVPFESGDVMRIATVGEMFSRDDDYETDDTEQWDLMKDRRNRIALREGKDHEWGWLQNKVKDSAVYFANVNYNGNLYYANASTSRGVRPVFQFKMGGTI